MPEKRLPHPTALRFTHGSVASRYGVAQLWNILRNYYRARRLCVVTIFLLLIYSIAMSLLILSCSGCANVVALSER